MRPSVLNLPRHSDPIPTPPLAAGHEDNVQGHIEEKNAALGALAEVKSIAAAATHAAAQVEERMAEALGHHDVLGRELADAKSALASCESDLTASKDALAVVQAELKDAQAKLTPGAPSTEEKKYDPPADANEGF